MAGYIGIQLALELSNVLPVRDVVHGAFAQLVNMARDLRNSGSDIVVEEDLADIFGRGHVSDDLERAFKAVVKIQRITPLYSGSEIELSQGPGPTMLRAFYEPRYFATVLTLSMLSYFLGRQNLASLLGFAMAKRFEANVPGSGNSPGFEGITGTLEACSTQSGEFRWGPYRDRIEEKLRLSIPNYRYSPDHCRLTDAVFLGILDFLYIVQSLPEDRKITISSEMGCIPLIIWAHYILGLTVVITGLPKDNIVFGNVKEPQIFITWSAERDEEEGDLFWPVESEDDFPVIRLLDKDMSIIIACEPVEENTLSSNTSERHPLRGYGTTYLRRILNVDTITQDDDSIYPEIVAYITGFAVHASRRMYRELDGGGNFKEKPQSKSTGQQIALEAWRIINSAKMLFDGILTRSDKASSYAEFFSESPLDESSIPVTLNSFLRKVRKGSSYIPPAKRLLQQVEHLAKLVLIFGHVIELEACGEMPLIITDDHVTLSLFMHQVSSAPDNYGNVDPQEIFHAIAELLCHRFDNRDDTQRFSSRSHYLFLCSDFGWSVYLNTVGDLDPAEVRPELVHVRKGTPTNAKTKERKLRIRDGIGFMRREYPDVYPVERGSECISRTVAKVLRRNEYWSSRLQEFELTIHTIFQVSPELQKHNAPKEMDTVVGYRKLQSSLWKTYSTPECEHDLDYTERSNSPKKFKIGPDVVVLLGWSLAGELLGRYPERIVVLLTKGERNLRWLAVEYTVMGVFSDRHRKPMLRTGHCCESCALEHVASLNGDWVLIL